MVRSQYDGRLIVIWRSYSSSIHIDNTAMIRVTALFLLACVTAPLHAATTALTGATLIDGTGAEPMAEAVVLMEDGSIVAVGPAAEVSVPDNAERVDLTGKWLIPGLIDAHIHFFQSGGLYTRPDVIDLRHVRSYAQERRRTRARLSETLARYVASGVTGVVDLGGPEWNFTVRRRAREAAIAPHVAVAGPLLGTISPPELQAAPTAIVAIDSPAQARQEVREQLAHKPDLIKLWLVPRAGWQVEEALPWIRAVIDESHAAGVPVVAHATELAIARAVVGAGVDILAHSIRDQTVDTDFIELLRHNDVVYVTTLVVQEGYREVLRQNLDLMPIERRLGDPEAIASWNDLKHHYPGPRFSSPGSISDTKLNNLRRLVRGGVTVAAGSDAGNIGTLHGPALHRELELMARALTPMEVLVAATRGGAKVLHRDDLGTLEVGQRADLLVLDADPLRDIRNTRRIHRVVLGGRVLQPQRMLARASASANH